MSDPAQGPRVVGLAGSLRHGSFTRRVVQLALEGAAEAGAETELIDLQELSLVFCDGGRDYPPAVGELKRRVRQAEGVILGTPEYHGSFSGVLKNALDLMGFGEMAGKMVGLVGVSGGSQGATNALNSLRSVGRSLHSWVVPEQASIARVREAFDETGRLRDEALEQRVREVGRQVARFAYLHSSEESRAFLAAWETAPANPGGGSSE